MSLEILFSVWAIALVLALLAIVVIVRPLFGVLVEVCGGRERARFWTVYSCVLTLMAPLLTVSAPGFVDAAAASGATGAILQRAVFYALVGIIGALVIIGRAVLRPISRMLEIPTAGDHRGPK